MRGGQARPVSAHPRPLLTTPIPPPIHRQRSRRGLRTGRSGRQPIAHIKQVKTLRALTKSFDHGLPMLQDI
eukprot:2269058-Pyramimonas_sp.AAC.1